MCGLSSSTNLSKRCLILRRTERDIVTNVKTKPEFYRQMFEKNLDIKFHENPSSGSPVPRERTNGHEANSRFSQFCERFQKCVQIQLPSPFRLLCLHVR